MAGRYSINLGSWHLRKKGSKDVAPTDSCLQFRFPKKLYEMELLSRESPVRPGVGMTLSTCSVGGHRADGQKLSESGDTAVTAVVMSLTVMSDPWRARPCHTSCSGRSLSVPIILR